MSIKNQDHANTRVHRLPEQKQPTGLQLCASSAIVVVDTLMAHPDIRLATLDDAPGLAEVHVRSWQQAYKGIVPQAHLDSLSVEWRQEKWRQNLSATASRTYVAILHQRVAGFCSVGPCRDEDSQPSQAEVPAIYVHPDYWDQGLGRLLWDRAIQDAQADGANSISAWVLADNHPARAFYDRVGCIDTGVRKTLPIGGKDLTAARHTQTLLPSDT